MSWTIRSIDVADTPSLEAYCAVINAVTPEHPASPEESRWAAATYPGGVRFLAELDGRPAGTGSVGRIYMYPPEFERLWLSIEVLPDARRQGVGSALYAACSEVARELGKAGFQTEVSERHADGLAFLARRGWVEIERSKAVRLDLAGVARPDPAPPAGVALTTLAERPDLLPAVHRLAEAAFPDIPGETPIAVGSLEEFRARDVDRPGVPPEAFVIALDTVSDEVVGYANLMLMPGSTSVAWHDMTAVHPGHRGRGIARAMKLATIRWASDAGLDALETGNDEANAPMRAINAALGYRPLPDQIMLRGPLAPEAGTAPPTGA